MLRIVIKATQILTVILLFLFSLISNAQQLENSLLWKVSGKNISKPSYLFGTMHLICNPTLSDKAVKALDETSQLYLEIDMSEEPNIIEEAKDFFMEDNQSIKDMISKEDYESLDLFFQKYMKINMELLHDVKPINITYLLFPYLLGCNAESIESELLRVTKEQQEATFGLESSEDHKKVVSDLSYPEQLIDLIELTKKDDETIKTETQKMVETYLEEDIEAMYLESMEGKENEEFKKVMLNNRNKKWIPVIEKAMKEKPTFFGFGAAHLAGDEGVIKLLRELGYKVEPIK